MPSFHCCIVPHSEWEHYFGGSFIVYADVSLATGRAIFTFDYALCAPCACCHEMPTFRKLPGLYLRRPADCLSLVGCLATVRRP